METSRRCVAARLAFALAFAQVLAPVCPALTLDDAAVVKTRSQTADGTLVFHGSGLLFRQGDHTYVLTSDHVILNDPKTCEQTASNTAWGEIRERLVYHDWGNGIALLEVTGSERPIAAARIPDFASLRPAAAQAEGPVSIAGFPVDDDQLIRDTQGKVQSPAIEKAFLAEQPRVIEIGGARGEYGMSGGPVFSAAGEWLGVLGYQKLEGAAGQLLYSIPATSLAPLLREVLAHPGEVGPALSIDLSQQIAQEESGNGTGIKIESGGWTIVQDQVASRMKAFLVIANQRRDLQPYRDRGGWLPRLAGIDGRAVGHRADGLSWILYFRRSGDLRASLEHPLNPASVVEFLRDLEDPLLTPGVYHNFMYPIDGTEIAPYQGQAAAVAAAIGRLPASPLREKLDTLLVAIRADYFLTVWNQLRPDDIDPVIGSAEFDAWGRSAPADAAVTRQALLALRRLVVAYTANGAAAGGEPCGGPLGRLAPREPR